MLGGRPGARGGRRSSPLAVGGPPSRCACARRRIHATGAACGRCIHVPSARLAAGPAPASTPASDDASLEASPLAAIRALLARAAAGDRVAFFDVGLLISAERRAGRTLVALGDALGIDPSRLADCSRLAAAWRREDAVAALAALGLAHCLALGAIADRAVRLRLADQAAREAMTVERVRVLVRAHVTGEDPHSGELVAIARAVLRLDARARAAFGRGTPRASIKAVRTFGRAVSQLAATAGQLEADAAGEARTSRKCIG